jgi:hypothetical protein
LALPSSENLRSWYLAGRQMTSATPLGFIFQ